MKGLSWVGGVNGKRGWRKKPAFKFILVPRRRKRVV